jgi:hypothetical protein
LHSSTWTVPETKPNHRGIDMKTRRDGYTIYICEQCGKESKDERVVAQCEEEHRYREWFEQHHPPKFKVGDVVAYRFEHRGKPAVEVKRVTRVIVEMDWSKKLIRYYRLSHKTKPESCLELVCTGEDFDRKMAELEQKAFCVTKMLSMPAEARFNWDNGKFEIVVSEVINE